MFGVTTERATLSRSAEQRFDTRHRAYHLQPLQQGDIVWIPEFQQNATVLSEVAPHSYIIQTPTGRVRRNRRYLTLLNEAAPTVGSPLDFDAETPPHQPPEVTATVSSSLPGTTIMRSGRLSKPPDRLNL